MASADMIFADGVPVKPRTDIFESSPMPTSFQITPELLELIKSDPEVESPLQDAKKERKLPALDDKVAILDFFGLSKDGVRLVLDAYNREYDKDPEQLAVWEVPDTGKGMWRFPLLSRLCDIYTGRADGDYDYDETWEGYMRKAVQQGLKPEFAVRVGMHPERPEYSEAQAEFWLKDTPQELCDMIINNNRARLTYAWNSQMAPPESS